MTGAKLFTVTGPNTVSTPISFTRFRPDKVAPNQTNVVLLGYDYIITKVTKSGTIGLLNVTSSTGTLNGPFQSYATLSFDRIDAASNVGFNPFNVSTPGTLPPNVWTNLPISGTTTN
ncbi:MAG: hypothetical protein ACKOZW_02925, partial [Cyanobium sp.]